MKTDEDFKYIKLIIAGCRDIHNYITMQEALLACKDYLGPFVKIEEIVSGGAKGVDTLGEKIAKENNIPVKIFPADWDKYGRMAGPIRNSQMADYADFLLAIWDNESKGTKNMIKTMEQRGLNRVFIYLVDKDEK